MPALVEIIVERETDAAMGKSIDKINEHEPVEDGDRELASQLADNIPERDSVGSPAEPPGGGGCIERGALESYDRVAGDIVLPWTHRIDGEWDQTTGTRCGTHGRGIGVGRVPGERRGRAGSEPSARP
ncbi:MAG TPA: hypothetical protein VF711_01920 [Acidimicrobiales bacterium]